MKNAAVIRPLGHVVVPVAVIGSLSLVLAVGLELLGISGRVDSGVIKMVTHGKEEGFPKVLPEWSGWFVALLFGFGLPWVMLSVAGAWRRWVLWVSAMFLTFSWAPVLVLAAHRPQIGIPLIVVSWAGICAMVYSSRHRMPCDSHGVDLKS